MRLRCALLGHDGRRACRCGNRLDRQGRHRMWHTITCFVGGHDYRRVAQRDGHHEYVCVDCGHPLLFADDRGDRFEKRVRYACNLFGHEVRRVASRGGLTEYACRCGHTFLKREPDLARVTHPPICTLRGHVIRFVERRGDLDEYTCERCGHTFCFAAEEGAALAV